MMSLHNMIPIAPPTLAMSTVNTTHSNPIVVKIINSIIITTLLSFIIQSVNAANYMHLLSKQVSHRSLGIGFIFRAHIICRIVTVGYKSSLHSQRVHFDLF